jgi:hypothetical protein
MPKCPECGKIFEDIPQNWTAEEQKEIEKSLETYKQAKQWGMLFPVAIFVCSVLFIMNFFMERDYIIGVEQGASLAIIVFSTIIWCNNRKGIKEIEKGLIKRGMVKGKTE